MDNMTTARLAATLRSWTLELSDGRKTACDPGDLNRQEQAMKEWAALAASSLLGDVYHCGRLTREYAGEDGTVYYTVVLIRERYPWAARLMAGSIPSEGPGDTTVHEIPIRISAADRPAAIVIAVRIPHIIDAIRDMDALDEAPGSALHDLLGEMRKVRLALANVEERIITTWHDRPTDSASFRDLGAALGIKFTSARERYLRIKEAGLTDQTAAVRDEERDGATD